MKKDFIVRRSITMVEGKPHVETYSEQELVRCKDCKHGYRCEFGIRCENKNMPPVFGQHFSENWFCADGVKKE